MKQIRSGQFLVSTCVCVCILEVLYCVRLTKSKTHRYSSIIIKRRKHTKSRGNSHHNKNFFPFLQSNPNPNPNPNPTQPHTHTHTLSLSLSLSTSLSTSLPFQRLLLFRINNNLLSRNPQPLSPPHFVYIPLRHILPIRQLAQVLELILCKRDPKGIFIQHLEAGKAQLRTRTSGAAFANLIRETETLRYWQQGIDCESLGTSGTRRGCRGKGFRQDGAATAG